MTLDIKEDISFTHYQLHWFFNNVRKSQCDYLVDSRRINVYSKLPIKTVEQLYECCSILFIAVFHLDHNKIMHRVRDINNSTKYEESSMLTIKI